MSPSPKSVLNITHTYGKPTGWLCLTSHRQRGHLETAPLAKDVKLGFYTVPTGNRTPGRYVAVYYTTSDRISQQRMSNLIKIHQSVVLLKGAFTHQFRKNCYLSHAILLILRAAGVDL